MERQWNIVYKIQCYVAFVEYRVAKRKGKLIKVTLQYKWRFDLWVDNNVAAFLV